MHVLTLIRGLVSCDFTSQGSRHHNHARAAESMPSAFSQGESITGIRGGRAPLARAAPRMLPSADATPDIGEANSAIGGHSVRHKHGRARPGESESRGCSWQNTSSPLVQDCLCFPQPQNYPPWGRPHPSLAAESWRCDPIGLGVPSPAASTPAHATNKSTCRPTARQPYRSTYIGYPYLNPP